MLKGWAFVSIALVMLVLAVVSFYAKGDFSAAISAAVGAFMALMAVGEFSKPRGAYNGDGEEPSRRRWQKHWYGLYHEVAGARRRRRRRYGR